MKRVDNDLTKPAFFKQYAPYVLTDSNLLSDFDKLSIYADIYNEFDKLSHLPISPPLF